METDKYPSENDKETQGNSRKLKETQGNRSNDTEDTKDVPEIVRVLAKRPEMRRELIKWVRKEFGYNIESWLEEYFDELPDKKYKIEDLAIPLREIAENVIGMMDDGYSPSQVAAELGIYRTQVTRILKERDRWEKEIRGVAQKQKARKLPWYLRFISRFI